MKKLIFILALSITVLHPVISAPVPNPIISRGKPVFTSKGAAAYLVDNKFNTSQWTVSNNSWLAIQVDSGPTSVIFNWNNPCYAWSNQLAPTQCPPSISFPIDFNLLTSPNSTDGTDGDWTIADTIRGNIVAARSHLINFSGAKWIKMDIIHGSGTLDEIEVFDASNGTDDTWFFAGTSISANAFKGTPPAKNFADIVTLSNPEYNPVMIRGGIGCISSTDFANNLPEYLAMAGNVHFWAIEMGTNDAWGGSNTNVTTFKQNMQRVIDSCKARGIEPIIARVLATDSAVANWQVHPDFLQAVDDLTFQNNLIAGPDLYTWFLAHPEELSGDANGVHPNSLGAASIQRLWAEKMDSLYGGCPLVQIIPYIQINTATLTLIASATLSQNDTLLLSPQVESATGLWSWSGPEDFITDTREVAINSIQPGQAGKYTVTFTHNDTCTFTYQFTIKVTALSEIPSMHLTSDNIRIYPNPAKGSSFNVAINNFSGSLKMQIFDLQGRLTYSVLLVEKETIINTNLSEGIYLVEFSNGQDCLSRKLILE